MFKKPELSYEQKIVMLGYAATPLAAVCYGATKTKKFVAEHKQAAATVALTAAALIPIAVSMKKLHDLEHANPFQN